MPKHPNAASVKPVPYKMVFVIERELLAMVDERVRQLQAQDERGRFISRPEAIRDMIRLAAEHLGIE